MDKPGSAEYDNDSRAGHVPFSLCYSSSTNHCIQLRCRDQSSAGGSHVVNENNDDGAG